MIWGILRRYMFNQVDAFNFLTVIIIGGIGIFLIYAIDFIYRKGKKK
jgi:hypothetical protein